MVCYFKSQLAHLPLSMSTDNYSATSETSVKGNGLIAKKIICKMV